MTDLQNILAVFAGSGLGGVCRYLVSGLVQGKVADSVFPWGTLTVNVLGCLIVGVFFGLASHYSFMEGRWKLLLAVGFCGGFTTFSTFVNENYHLITAANGWMAVLYTALSLVAGFGCLYLGYLITGRTGA